MSIVCMSLQMSEELKEKKVAAAEPTDRLIQDEKVETGSVSIAHYTSCQMFQCVPV